MKIDIILIVISGNEYILQEVLYFSVVFYLVSNILEPVYIYGSSRTRVNLE